MSLPELIEKLSKLRERLSGYEALVRADALLADILEDLHAVQDSAGDKWLTLNEAALTSGYSPEHLRRLVREGRLTVERRGRRLYVREGSLPRKSATLTATSTGSYDPVADARKIAGKMKSAASRSASRNVF